MMLPADKTALTGCLVIRTTSMSMIVAMETGLKPSGLVYEVLVKKAKA